MTPVPAMIRVTPWKEIDTQSIFIRKNVQSITRTRKRRRLKRRVGRRNDDFVLLSNIRYVYKQFLVIFYDFLG